MDIIIIYLLILIIPAIASFNINSNYKKFKQIELNKKISGFEVARKILDENKAERHIRGGMATKLKYSHEKEKNVG